MEKTLLLAKNPWWKGKEHFKEDEDYRKWEGKKVKWIPQILNEIKFNGFSLNFLFGPRQVGKTTLTKLIIKSLLDSMNLKNEQIFYFRCDELKDYKELEELLNSYYEFREEHNIAVSYIFLDEITFAEDWFRTIKSWIDEGKFKNDFIFITGSASFEIMKHAEYFPGRRGNGRDFLMLPLSFREFVKIMNLKIFENLLKISSFEEKEIENASKKAFLFLKELNSLLKIYFKVGGFPLAINSYIEDKIISSEAKETYLSWIKNDIVKVKRNINTAREILKSVLTKIPTPISWENISKETSIKSPKTINAYLHMFEEMFVIIISYYLNLNNLTTEFGKNKKIHLIDPLFYELFEEWCLVEIKDKENKKAEDLAASHLFRFARKLKDFSGEVFYWKNSTEIDSLIRAKDRAIGFEVKWVEKVKPIRLFLGKMKNCYMLSKESFDLKNKIIPLSVFLSMLDA